MVSACIAILCFIPVSGAGAAIVVVVNPLVFAGAAIGFGVPVSRTGVAVFPCPLVPTFATVHGWIPIARTGIAVVVVVLPMIPTRGAIGGFVQVAGTSATIIVVIHPVRQTDGAITVNVEISKTGGAMGFDGPIPQTHRTVLCRIVITAAVVAVFFCIPVSRANIAVVALPMVQTGTVSFVIRNLLTDLAVHITRFYTVVGSSAGIVLHHGALRASGARIGRGLTCRIAVLICHTGLTGKAIVAGMRK